MKDAVRNGTHRLVTLVAALLLGLALVLGGGLELLVTSAARVDAGIFLEEEIPTWGHDVVLLGSHLVLADSLGLDVYVRTPNGYVRTDRIWTNESQTPFLAKREGRVVVLESHGHVTFYEPEGDSITAIGGFDIPRRNEKSPGYELDAVAWSGEFLAAAGEIHAEHDIGALVVIRLEGLALAETWSFLLPETGHDVEVFGSGFLVCAGGLFRVHIWQEPELLGPIPGFEGSREAFVTSQGIAVARETAEGWNLTEASLGLRSLEETPLSLIPTDRWSRVADLASFGGSIWLAGGRAGLLRVSPGGGQVIELGDREQFDSLDAEGLMMAAFHGHGLAILVLEAESVVPLVFVGMGTAIAVVAACGMILRRRRREKANEAAA